MKESSFDYEGAVKAGYSDEEIIDHLASSHPDFDVNEAYRSGYSSKEINQHLSTREKPEPKKERSLLAKAGRIAGQYALGRAEGTTPGMIYDVATLPLRLPGGKETLRDMFTSEFLSEVYPTEEEGKAPAVEELQPPTDISIRGLVGKATGIDTHPEGFLEKMAAWTGFVKGEKGTSALKSVGLNPGTVTKAIAPGFKDLSRGVFAGAALQMAENGNFGPLGTIAAAVVGDIMGHSPKGIIKAIMNPKQTAAQAVNFLTQSNSQKLASAQLIEDFAKSGIQLDAGTLSGSPLG